MNSDRSRRAQICGLGVVTALGDGLEPNVAGIAEGIANSSRRTLGQLAEPTEVSYLQLAPSSSRLDSFDAVDSAVEQALSNTALSSAQRRHIPLFIGSSSYAIGQSEALFAAALNDSETDALPVQSAGFGQISRHLRAKHGLCGPDYLFNTACTASANALLIAAEHIEGGYCDHALVIGVELLNITTVAGFYGMQLLAKDIMRPFDQRRDGLVLGEGCGVILLGPAGRAQNGLFISGGASGCDTFSITTSNPDGVSNAKVMTQALNNACLVAEDVTAIKAHGTATPLNDDAEAAGMRQVFEEPPPIFALKPYVGHTLGACGAVETVLISAAIRAGFLPVSGGYEVYDEELGVRPLTSAMAVGSGHFMLNFFGFGGNNASILLFNEAGDV